MRLGTVLHKGTSRVVVASDDGLIPVDTCRDMLGLIEAEDLGLEQAATALHTRTEVLDQGAVTFLPPIMPVQYRDCLVFEEHLKNSFAVASKMTGRAFDIPPVWYDQPIYYKGNRMSFVGHKADVIWPDYADFLDLELELAIIVGRKGKNIQPEDAERYIFGYSVLNDVSARDAQMVEMPGQLGPAKGKDFDTGNVLGPSS